ncbi:hypothetical protein NUM_43710 [Actinocatenispora comari]|uniref:Uncharacterized protein n=1 Tax=Actinocatenispora comari TaxID=2807577 RepID=A0A8J4AH41_9ACTN|nr:hypothetical protein NUM_43710 [Actinocatenispora comari]
MAVLPGDANAGTGRMWLVPAFVEGVCWFFSVGFGQRAVPGVKTSPARGQDRLAVAVTAPGHRCGVVVRRRVG